MELVNLLLQSRDNNERLGLTGALVYGDGQFMQVIEGDKQAVTALYARIAADPRHQGVFKMADKTITERTFHNWSMAFRELSSGEFADLVGYMSPDVWEQLTVSSNSPDALLLDRMRELVVLPHAS